MYQPSFEEALVYTKDYHLIPISCEIPSDMTSPIAVLKALKTVSTHCFLLESVADSKAWGRYSFLGYEPTLELTCLNGELKIRTQDSTVQKILVSNPSDYIRHLMSTLTSPKLDYLPSFTGGLVGYFAYDYIKYSEPTLTLDANDEENFHDVDLMLFQKVIVFDNLLQKLYIIVNVKAEELKEHYHEAVNEIERIKTLLKSTLPEVDYSGRLTSPFRPLFNASEYCALVEQAKKHIFEGDIFQVVLSNRLEADFEGSLLNTYRMLRMTNPSPYMFYFGSDKMELTGASPETLVKLQDSVLHTFPIAGTRKRGETEAEDLALELELLADEKELAEHNMLVDLGRNDLGKISKFGTVQIENYKSILRFSHVTHIGSTIRGELREDLSAMDAIEAVLPAGTLSGAPKLRACEIINQLENNKRGIYGGAVGYLDFKGNMDTCIAIRLCFQKNGKVFVRSGAGIVADSIPEKEYEECLNKAKAVMEALQIADGGLAT